jgi:hypothetical protein
MKRRVRVLVAGWMLILAPASGHVRALGQQPPGGPAAHSGSEPRALLNRYCITCHNQKTRTAGLALDTMDVSRVGEHAEVWERVVRKLRGGLMPPAGRPRPEPDTYGGFINWLEAELDGAAALHPNPGRKETLHRLNRVEYRNAIRDLLALDVDETLLLPADDASYGFDNIAGILKIDQSRMERYLAAATKISRAALGGPSAAPSSETFVLPAELPQYDHIDGLPFGTRGGTLIQYNFPQDGDYVINVELLCATEPGTKCDAAGGFNEPHQLEISVDDERVGLFTLEARPMQSGYKPEWDDLLKVRVPVRAGPRRVAVTFLKTLPSIEYVRPGLRVRFQKPFRYYADVQRIYEPFIDRVTITGPYDPRGSGDTPSRRRVLVCRPASAADEASCAKLILSKLARHAFRRPVNDVDLERLLVFYRDGRRAGFEAGIETALRRLLVSPEFLFRIERDPPSIAPNTSYRVSDLELASRLSFFLWSSIPDDELLDAADHGLLQDPAALERQARRMIADPRSRALVDNFISQWLQLRNVDAARPSAWLIPDFDEGLRHDLRRETELFCESIIREDRSAVDLLRADFTFVNERLARHYGIPYVKGSRFRRVTIDDNNRRGLLGQGSILTVTSRPNRTSPVLRGRWILENILGTPPPSPPANVPAFAEKEDGSKARVLSMRDRMSSHRTNAVCASCHSVIDPLGFALENFDAVGRWRDVDEAFSRIDVSGALPDGSKVDGPAALRQALLNRPERFVMTMTEKLLTYAIGRGVEYYDMPALRKIVREARADDYRFSSLVLGIVNSRPFQMRSTGS